MLSLNLFLYTEPANKTYKPIKFTIIIVLLITFILLTLIFLIILYKFLKNNEKKIFFSRLKKPKISKGLLVGWKRFKPFNLYKFSVLFSHHYLICGATGSGKTSKIIIPNLKFLSKIQKLKNSYIIYDPKTEIYQNTADDFINTGYKNIFILNLSDQKRIKLKNGSKSLIWNPVHGINLSWKKFKKSYYKSKKHYESLKIQIDFFVDEYLHFNNKELSHFDVISSLMLKSLIYITLENIDEKYFTIEELKKVIKSLIINKQIIKNYIKENKILFFKEEYDVLKNNIANQKNFLFLNNILDKMAIFNLQKLKSITNFKKFSNLNFKKPTVIYIFGSENFQKYKDFIALFFEFVYEEWKKVKQLTKSKNYFYWFLDEAGTSLKIKNIDLKVSYARTFNISYIFSFQDIEQINRLTPNRETFLNNINTYFILENNSLKTKQYFLSLSNWQNKTNNNQKYVLKVIKLLQKQQNKNKTLILNKEKKYFVSLKPYYKF